MSRRLFGNESKYLEEVLRTEFRTSAGGVMSKRLEEAFARRYGSEFAISFCNGTATMHSALEAWGISPGDEVILPPLTMSSTTFAVLQANATPVYADVDLETFQISVASIESKITERTRAIITVSLFGLCPDMDPIIEICKKHGLLLLEDNAECFLGTYKGNLVGTLGDCSSFSFQSSKHLTSGEGGIVITNNITLAEKIRKISRLGYASVGAINGGVPKSEIQNPNYSRHLTLGWNYRMPELCCAVALAQVENIDQLVMQRVNVAGLFNEVVKGYEDWFVPQRVGSDYGHSYWTWAARLEGVRATWTEFRNKFLSFGGDNVYAAWRLSYLEPFIQNSSLLGRENFISSGQRNNYKQGLCPIAEHLQQRIVQFKTNYWDFSRAEMQAEALAKTLKSL